ncbi:MAG TPA: maleylpyruvate isomerase N-terminal domain-containing protein [Herpetosiphonaceae bacterium]|nr:maleylpyruvate isomerase N-terminal domain-containing protein [Herpetosiphonaceae bacterium]
MDNAGLLAWLDGRYGRWSAQINAIDPAIMDQPGVNGTWSVKDVVGHLTGWNRWLVARLGAACQGEPKPLPPWPAELTDENDINAWIYAAYRDRPAREVLDETHAVHQQLRGLIVRLPPSARIEHVEPAFYLVWVGGERFLVGEFFDHFHDDHEPDLRAWLARAEAGTPWVAAGQR